MTNNFYANFSRKPARCLATRRTLRPRPPPQLTLLVSPSNDSPLSVASHIPRMVYNCTVLSRCTFLFFFFFFLFPPKPRPTGSSYRVAAGVRPFDDDLAFAPRCLSHLVRSFHVIFVDTVALWRCSPVCLC